MNEETSPVNMRCDVAAWILAGVVLVAVLKLHLLPALIIGFSLLKRNEDI